MRQEQLEKLQALEEKLVDVFLGEAEPDNWPGAGIALSELTQQHRGDRYWMKKNAVGTLSLVQRINNLMHTANIGDPNEADAEEASELDKEINAAEKEATKLMKDLTNKAKKAAFDARTHGKAG